MEDAVAYLDFQQIKQDHSIEAVAERLGLDIKKSGHQLRAPCPACESGGERALAITPAKGAFYCFGGSCGGDVLQLVAHVQGCSVKDAATWIVDAKPEEKRRKPEPSSGEGDGFKPLDYLEAAHDAVVALGFDPEDAERIGVGYAKRGVMRGTVAVPVRLEDGTLIGYIGVTEAKLPTSWRF
jgi:hypothetical protein